VAAQSLVRPRLVAPCSPVANTPARKSRFQASLQRLEANGVEPMLNGSVWAEDDYLAGSDEERAEALLGALASDSPLIWAARGGYGAMRLLPTLERELPQLNQNRMFLGFSDLTALFPLLTRRGYRCVHGPVVSQAGSLVEGGDAGFVALVRALRDCSSTRELRFRGLVPENEGTIQGSLVGGNLSLCAALAGTRFAPDYEEAILFIEDVGEPAYRLDRCLTQLELSGVFQQIRGLLVGDLGARGAQAVMAHRRLREICDKWSIPMITGLPVGHGSRNACLGYGAMVKVHYGAADKAGRGPCLFTEIS